MKEKIINAISSPEQLEILYQGNPEGFEKEFLEIFSQYPDSLILQTWNERLTYKHKVESQNKFNNSVLSLKNFIIIAILVLFGGTLFNFYLINENYGDPQWFFARIFWSANIIFLMVYFFFQKEVSLKTIFFVSTITLISLIYLLVLLPNQHTWEWNYSKAHRTFRDALTSVELHIPILLWLITGISFIGPDWRISANWMNYLRYNGEFLIYLTLISISIFVLSGITMMLLGFIEKDWELSKWYQENVIMYEVAAAPIVATFLIDKLTGKRLRIAPILSRIFSPLFLITTSLYLIIMITYQKNPYNDREALVTFNFLMLLVLGMSIFSIAERNPNLKSGFSDYVNIGLIATTIIINLIVLSAVIFRVFNDEYGFTPNRIMVLGINLLVFIHLLGILIYYSRFTLNKTPYEKIEEWVTKYLPAYAVWAIAIAIIMPILFWYK